MAESEILRFIADISQQLLNCEKSQNNNLEKWLQLPKTQQTLREIKADFKNRDYLSVFLTSPDRLAVYLAHYIGTRSLCYYQLLQKNKILDDVLCGRDQLMSNELDRRRKQRRTGQRCAVEYAPDPAVRIACIGAGAGSELVALLFSIARNIAQSKQLFTQVDLNQLAEMPYTEFERQVEDQKMPAKSVELNIIDIADWSLVQSLISRQAASDSRLAGRVSIRWTQSDILSLNETRLTELASCNLITMMFVLNELFASSKAATVQMLTRLIRGMSKCALLLLVESAGSFSELKIGQQNYMVYRLLDKVPQLKLMNPGQDSVWYRFDPYLASKSIIPLNSMRYFMRIYQKL